MRLQYLALGAAALAVAFAASPVQAITLSFDTLAKNAANAANQTNATGQNWSEFLSSGTLISSGALTFTTRYAATAAVDRQNTTSSHAASFQTDYRVEFDITGATGFLYDVVIESARIGSLVLVTDSAGSATANLGAATAKLDDLEIAQLALSSVGPLSSSASATQAFNQTVSHQFSTGGDQSFVLNFAWLNGLLTSAQDEAAIRLGLDCTIANVTACDYASTTARNADGHFVTVSLINIREIPPIVQTPEPAALALLGLGLLGAARMRRKV